MRSAVLFLLVVTGCWLPKTELTRTSGAVRWSEPILERQGPVEFVVRRDARRVTVSAEHRGHCRRELHQTVTVSETRKAKLVGGGGLTALLILAYPAGLASLAVSVIANAGNGTKSYDVDETVSSRAEVCRTPARDLAVQVEMPSGAVVVGLLDEQGMFTFESDEPPGGVRATVFAD